MIVSRNRLGEISHFPVVEMEFNPQVNLVEFLCSPARVSKEIEEKAQDISVRLKQTESQSNRMMAPKLRSSDSQPASVRSTSKIKP